MASKATFGGLYAKIGILVGNVDESIWFKFKNQKELDHCQVDFYDELIPTIEQIHKVIIDDPESQLELKEIKHNPPANARIFLPPNKV